MKQHLNTGERRGLIVIIAILSIIIAIIFFLKLSPTSMISLRQLQTDSIAKVLRSKVEEQDSTQHKEKKSKRKNKSKKTKNKKSTNNFVEREFLNESLPISE